MMKLEEHITLAPYTYYKIGGPARFFVEARTSRDIREALEFAKSKDMPYFILGNGSNVLVADEGYPGLVIHIALNQIEIEGSKVKVEAGVAMGRIVAVSVAAGLTGIEWAIGIPGALGGSIRGNAGCFGGEMKDVLDEVGVFNVSQMKEEVISRGRCRFQYRDSMFKRHPEYIVLWASLNLLRGDKIASQKMIAEYAKKRSETQAIGSKSAGCIFKNVSWESPVMDKIDLLAHFPAFSTFLSSPNIPAAYCIEAAGLKGERVGGVEISVRHANYFINSGKATAGDVIALIKTTKERVEKKFNLKLEEEIQYIGF